MESVSLLELKHIRNWSKKKREMGEQKEEHRMKTQGPMSWMTPEVVFAWKTAFHSLCLSLSSSPSLFLSFLLAAWRASGALLASSQEVKLNCRARLPNDERLWHPGMLWAWTKSSEQEKMLAFQLNTFFLRHFFSLAFFGVGFPSSGWAFF